MADAFFVATSATVSRQFRHFQPTEHVVGPWNPAHMHGGPPSALLAHSIAQQTAGQVIPDPGFICRMTVEILKPVPVADVEITTRIVRPGRRIALVDAAMSAGGETVMLARAWFIRTASIDVPATRQPAPPPMGEALAAVPDSWGSGYLQAIDWREVSGTFAEPGPATAWTRSRYPLVEGCELTGIERVMLVADSGNGLSSAADPSQLIFVNPELTVHLLRPPDGDWIWMSAETFLDPRGVGLATTTLGDRTGQLGIGNQSLFVAPTRR